ncbi:hypothetical protein J7E90_12070 [Streptomyces sp. ISL-111]|uniref:hypothetical protein n=1 Tax=unclassified Streptomyces TaxID=2593676 RepID=UPI001BE59A97|nr:MULTISPECIES: hypothetical protein [unclassified Streptomyces]MBT2378067.1 hypothetical protein [Streptomyces sp. ISL-111]MBT2425032.1 hypothetical protein [Streptomyces sp. ISL-112]MBT2460315.1 hypothetical protein [Streptomyces sp. ISL-63]
MKTEHTPRTEAAEGTGPGSPDAPDRRTADSGNTDRRPAHRRDLIAAAAGVVLVTAAILIGHAVQNRTGTLQVRWPPLLASWDPHLGPGTPAALAMAVLVIAYGPPLAARLSWRAILTAAWAGSAAWVFSMALIDGWYRGVERRLTTKHEYLRVIDRFEDIPATLRDFTDHIVIGEPGNWPAHVAGHPPGATLTFVWLDRIGLGGGAWAAVWCVVVGSSAVLAALITVRVLADEHLARRAAPFLVLAPAAVWAGVSADGYFTAVAAWSVALLALAATRRVRFPAVAAVGGGLLFGWTCYLSYGLGLMAAVLLAVLVLARTARPVVPFLLGALVVPAAFTLAGFNWWTAYHLLVERYYQGAGGVRPYAYWVWANLACAVLAAGLAAVAGVRRSASYAPGAVRALRTGTAAPAQRLALLVLAALVALLAADLSGMSKAETERIWQPFLLWLLPAAALLPTRTARYWLVASVVPALLINHLLWTGW